MSQRLKEKWSGKDSQRLDYKLVLQNPKQAKLSVLFSRNSEIFAYFNSNGRMNSNLRDPNLEFFMQQLDELIQECRDRHIGDEECLSKSESHKQRISEVSEIESNIIRVKWSRKIKPIALNHFKPETKEVVNSEDGVFQSQIHKNVQIENIGKHSSFTVASEVFHDSASKEVENLDKNKIFFESERAEMKKELPVDHCFAYSSSFPMIARSKERFCSQSASGVGKSQNGKKSLSGNRICESIEQGSPNFKRPKNDPIISLFNGVCSSDHCSTSEGYVSRNNKKRHFKAKGNDSESAEFKSELMNCGNKLLLSESTIPYRHYFCNDSLDLADENAHRDACVEIEFPNDFCGESNAKLVQGKRRSKMSPTWHKSKQTVQKLLNQAHIMSSPIKRPSNIEERKKTYLKNFQSSSAKNRNHFSNSMLNP